MAFVPSCEEDVAAEWIQKDVLSSHIEGDFRVVRHRTEASDGGDREGFLSLMVRTETEVQVEGEEETRTYHLFIKMFPPNEHHRAALRELRIFEREIHVYSSLLDQIRSAQGDAEPLLEPSWPKCFYACSNAVTKEAALVFEDLSATGFRLMSRFDGLDKEHMLLAVQALARDHALTFNVKTTVGVERFLLNNVPILDEPYRTSENYVLAGYDTAVHIIRGMNEEELANRMEAYRDRQTGDLMLRFTSLTQSRDNMMTVQHGDVWVNNLMFQHDENSRPVSVKLLDFQLVRYAHICTDIHLLLNSSASREAREPLDQLLRSYYDSFFHVLEQLRNPLQKTAYPFEEFEADFEYFWEFGYLMGIMYIPDVMSEAEEMPDLDSMGDDMMATLTGWVEQKRHRPVSEKLQNRLLDLVRECAEHGVI